MDIVFIKGLEAQAVIGAYAWERDIRQTLVFDVEMATSVDAAALTDDLADTDVDYAAVAGRIREFVEASAFELIEALGARLIALLQTEFTLPWVRLTVHKPRPDDGFTAGLILERGDRT